MYLQGNVRFGLLLCSQASAKSSAVRTESVKIFIMSIQMHINAFCHRVLSALQIPRPAVPRCRDLFLVPSFGDEEDSFVDTCWHSEEEEGRGMPSQ